MVIVTGASKGVGRFLFTRFKEINETVIGTYNSTFTGLEQDKIDYYSVDISDFTSVQAFVQSIKKDLQNIVLINCAGISYNSFAHKSDISQWDKVIDVNVKGTFYMIRELLPLMREQNFGRIINFSSVVTQIPTQGVSAYAASKSALIGLTKSLATENGSKGITVNAINLGYVNLGMGINDVPEAYQEKMKNQIPSRRFCEPEEVFQTVQYLVKTEYVNGTAIDINGGLI
ncbi:3-ketoacyl-ACP reductase [Bacteroidia bacterium]|nr:3-ketoacyl-ACP reductase [Bacteroidia bacterium]GHV71626.1 3-ketoacyl-ACP reductase [Bacteroidia bacterium]